MRRSALLRHLRRHGCNLKREGRAHSLWQNPTSGVVEAIPRHSEIPNQLARKICRSLSIPAHWRVKENMVAIQHLIDGATRSRAGRDKGCAEGFGRGSYDCAAAGDAGTRGNRRGAARHNGGACRRQLEGAWAAVRLRTALPTRSARLRL